MALTPAWQAEPFIEATLASLAAQTWPNLEILISVDQSSDRTAEICLAHAARHPNVRVIVQPERLGWVGNTNWLLEAARGDYLLFAFHDDILGPTYIERMVEALEAEPQAVIAFSDVELAHQDGTTEACCYDVLSGVDSPRERAARVLRRTSFWFVPNRGVFRASAARAIGGLRVHSAGEFAADWPWLVHMATLGKSLRVAEVLCWKYFKPKSLSRSWDFSKRDWLGVTESCAGAIGRSGLGAADKLRLQALLWSWYGRKVASAALRRLTARRPEPAESR